MKKAILTLLLSISLLIMFAQSNVNNPGFETWDGLGGSSEEPQQWNSFMTASGSLTSNAAQQINRSTLVRPGSTGTYSAHIWSRSITIIFVTVIANGNMTTGRVNMGSATPSNSANYNGTVRSDANFSETFTAYPDSFVVWVQFNPNSSGSEQARFHAIIHDNSDLRDPGYSAANVKAEATLNFPRTNSTWVRKSVPFVYNANLLVPAYILISFTTNMTPGTGNNNDHLYVDDIEFIYNVNLSSLTTSQGTLVPSFSPNVTNYTVTLPYGTTATPTVNALTASPNATRVITPAADITSANIADRTTTVVVTGGDGTTTKTYNVVFNVELSNDASLSYLASSLGNISPAFNPDTLNYHVILPHGTVLTPITTATPNNPLSTFLVTDATDITSLNQSERTTGIRVVAPNGINTRDYSIIFDVNPLNNNASLDSISVSLNALSDFNSDTLYYEIELPYGTTLVPPVEAFASDINARVLITPATELPGFTTIVVKAEDTTFITTYIIYFFLANPSNDASLANLKLDDVLISGFNPITFIYYHYLPQGTVVIPTVTAQANHQAAIVTIIPASNIPGQAEINVTAQDGITFNSYNVNFAFDNAVNENETQFLNMFPMPANDYISLNISESLKNAKFSILSTTAQIVYESTLLSTTNIINTSELLPGYYMFTIENNSVRKNGYLLINR